MTGDSYQRIFNQKGYESPTGNNYLNGNPKPMVPPFNLNGNFNERK